MSRGRCRRLGRRGSVRDSLHPNNPKANSPQLTRCRFCAESYLKGEVFENMNMPKEEAWVFWLLAGNARGGVERPTYQSQDRCVEKTDHDRAGPGLAVWAEGPARVEAIEEQDRRRRDVHALRQDHNEYALLRARASTHAQTFLAQLRTHRD